MTLKWPIMCWCAVKKLLIHSNWASNKKNPKVERGQIGFFSRLLHSSTAVCVSNSVRQLGRQIADTWRWHRAAVAPSGYEQYPASPTRDRAFAPPPSSNICPRTPAHAED